ncbi:DNA repair protein rad52 [Linderina macrospora]|uniref:DNA repair protein rad52 n=1 Tax=Linderina macrospora TaxID=4868 RepID=A0ACC1JFP7_9FUNG|nr:DNA repair protein rad52 [Linderina macrospora]
MNRLNDSIFAPSSPFQPLDSYPCEPFLPYDASRIQHALSRKLGPEHISSRRGAGNMTLSYIEGWRAISIANEIFGFNGWRSNLFNMVVDFVDVDSQTGNVSIGLSCMVRITLRDGTYREDAGYGLIENCKSKAQAFEKVRKEAVTDALKRAMRQFGNVLGNCLYDKDFLRYVAREPKERRTDLSSGKLFRNSDLDVSGRIL